MIKPTKCCGSCQWFNSFGDGSMWGTCRAPLPHSIRSDSRHFVHQAVGTTCPCHKLKKLKRKAA